MHVAPDLYFWRLVASHSGSELYGITSEGTLNGNSAGLARIDAHSGNVLQYRPLDTDYWWIVDALLITVPSGNVSLTGVERDRSFKSDR